MAASRGSDRDWGLANREKEKPSSFVPPIIMMDYDSLDPLCNLYDDLGFDSGDESDTNVNDNARLLQQMEEDDISDEEYEEQLEEILAYSTAVHEEVEATL